MKSIMKYYNEMRVWELLMVLIVSLVLISWKVLQALYVAMLEFVNMIADDKKLKNKDKSLLQYN